MINKEQFKILKFIQPHDVTNPIDAVEIINYPFYKNRADQVLTDKHLHMLSKWGYIEPYDSLDTCYYIGYTGYLFLTPSGEMAINDYTYQVNSVRSANIKSWIAIGISVIALLLDFLG